MSKLSQSGDDSIFALGATACTLNVCGDCLKIRFSKVLNEYSKPVLLP